MSEQTKQEEQKQEEVKLPETRNARVDAAITNLSELVTKQEQAAEESATLRTFASALGRVTGIADKATEEENAKVAQALGEDGLSVWSTSLEGLRSVLAMVSKSAGLDTEGGDQAVKVIEAAITVGVFDDLPEQLAEVNALMERFKASAPKKSGGSRAGSANPPKELGFTLTMHCEREGCNWKQTTTKDNLNSFRNAWQKHEKATHQNVMTAKGDASFTGITEAIDKAMHHGEQATQGATVRITRSA